VIRISELAERNNSGGSMRVSKLELLKTSGNRLRRLVCGEPRMVQQLKVQGVEWSVNCEDRVQIRTEKYRVIVDKKLS
jgi:hypothetical protein